MDLYESFADCTSYDRVAERAFEKLRYYCQDIYSHLFRLLFFSARKINKNYGSWCHHSAVICRMCAMAGRVRVGLVPPEHVPAPSLPRLRRGPLPLTVPRVARHPPLLSPPFPAILRSGYNSWTKYVIAKRESGQERRFCGEAKLFDSQ